MAKLYRPGSGARGEPCDVVFLRDAARVSVGSDTLDLPWGTVELRQEGFENAFFVLASAGTEVWVAHERLGELTALADHLPEGFRGRLAALVQTDRHTRSRGTALMWGGVASVLALCVFVCSGGLASAVVAMTPTHVDTLIGQAANAATADVACSTTGPTAEVQAIVDRLTAQLDDNPYTWNARVVHNPVPNAFALPGGYITVHSGLIDILDSPDALAGILGHEVTHATERHGLERLVHEMSLPVLLPMLVGDASFAVEAAVMMGASAQSLAYSRSQENASDEFGQELAAKAGYDPAAIADAFDAIAEYEGDMGSALAIFSTHPDTQGRATHMRERATTLQRGHEPAQHDWEVLSSCKEL